MKNVTFKDRLSYLINAFIYHFKMFFVTIGCAIAVPFCLLADRCRNKEVQE